MAAIVSRMALAMEFTFVMGLAREEVITILVKGSSTNACCLDEGGGRIGRRRQRRRESP
jgi:hypothetical protein